MESGVARGAELRDVAVDGRHAHLLEAHLRALYLRRHRLGRRRAQHPRGQGRRRTAGRARRHAGRVAAGGVVGAVGAQGISVIVQQRLGARRRCRVVRQRRRDLAVTDVRAEQRRRVGAHVRGVHAAGLGGVGGGGVEADLAAGQLCVYARDQLRRRLQPLAVHHVVDQLLIDPDALALEELAELVPVVELALEAVAVVVAVHLDVVHVVPGEDLRHQEAIREVTLDVLHRVGEVKRLQPLEELPWETRHGRLLRKNRARRRSSSGRGKRGGRQGQAARRRALHTFSARERVCTTERSIFPGE
jgi:hypothetical protein